MKIQNWTFDETLLLGKVIPNCAVEHKIKMEYIWSFNNEVDTSTSNILFVMPKNPTYTWCKIVDFKYVEKGYYSNFGYLKGIELVLEDTKQAVESIDYVDDVFTFKIYSKEQLIVLKQLRKLFNNTFDYNIEIDNNKLVLSYGFNKSQIYKLIEFYQINSFDSVTISFYRNLRNLIRFYDNKAYFRINKKWITLKLNSRRFQLYCAFIKGKITTSQYLKELQK